jgi:hypothetical protein
MTLGDILDEVRDAVSDAASIRWPNAAMYRFAYSAEMAIVGSHPESQYILRVSNPTPTLLTATTQAFTIADDYRQPMVHMMAYLILSGDADDANNLVLAKEHLRMYHESVGDQK